MTPTRYILARIALTFGLDRRQRRMADAASESHLLREAEQVLGRRIWKNVEEIEELGIEYWNLRRHVAEHERLSKQLEEARERLENAQTERDERLDDNKEALEQAETEYSETAARLESLGAERERIIARARELRRVYDGLKTKLEVLESENRGDSEVIESTRSRMDGLREEFTQLKARREELSAELATCEEELRIIGRKVEDERKERSQKASGASQNISNANRSISSLKADIGLIEAEMQQLFGEIGRHISRHAASDERASKASRPQRQLVEVMAALRKSITLNHRLAGS